MQIASPVFLLKALACAGRAARRIRNHPLCGWGQPALQSRPLAGHLRLFRPQGIRVEKAYSLSHTKWMCKYHVVFTPKYRRKVIYNQIRSDLGEIFRKLCQYKGIEIIEGHLMPDHVHMLLAIPPKYSVSSVMGYLKGKSSLMVFDRHANMKYKFGNRKFWAEGYYVSTVGLNEATIAKYIREQEKADIALDRLSVKEYEDPFDRGPGRK